MFYSYQFLNKTFPSLARNLNKDCYLENIKANFLLLASYRRFPKDDEFKRDFQTKDLYNFRSRSYWLRRIENFDRKERVIVDNFTIEHILPQKENLTPAWRTDLGSDWERIQETWLNTLGNLTLTGYNSELSYRSFIEKRDMPGGFADSPIRLNHGLGSLDHWNEEEIIKRAHHLSTKAVKVWKAPELEPDILTNYRFIAPRGGYTIDDHPFLAHGVMRKLFDEFRQQTLSGSMCHRRIP